MQRPLAPQTRPVPHEASTARHWPPPVQQPVLQELFAQQALPGAPQASHFCVVPLHTLLGAVQSAPVQQFSGGAPHVPQLPLAQVPRPLGQVVA